MTKAKEFEYSVYDSLGLAGNRELSACTSEVGVESLSL